MQLCPDSHTSKPDMQRVASKHVTCRINVYSAADAQVHSLFVNPLACAGAVKEGGAPCVQPTSKRAKVDKPARQAKKSMLVQASMPALFQRDCTKHQVSSIAIHTLHICLWAAALLNILQTLLREIKVSSIKFPVQDEVTANVAHR